MPRARKTQTGAPAQPAQAPRGGPYGSGEAALESQRRTPLPAGPVPAPSAPPAAGPPGPPNGAPAGGGADPMAAAVAAAQQMAPAQSIFDQPTDRPNEPLYAGMGQMDQTVNPNPALWELRAVAKNYPYPDLIRFLQRAQMEA